MLGDKAVSSVYKGSVKVWPSVNNNGHDYVDLDLPSGNLWASKNIGANTPQELGLWFKWGTTDGKATFNEAYSLAFPYENKYTAENGPRQLDLEDDAAHANWGGNWVTPSFNDFIELLNHTNIFAIKDDNSEVALTLKDQVKSLYWPIGLTLNEEDYVNAEFITTGVVLSFKFQSKLSGKYIIIPGWGRPDSLPTSWNRMYSILLNTQGFTTSSENDQVERDAIWNGFLGETVVSTNGILTSNCSISISTSNIRPIIRK